MSTVGYERFLIAMSNWSAEGIDPYLREKSKRDLMTPQHRKLIDDVFARFQEIDSTLDNLDMAIAFIKGPVPRRKGLRQDKYLLYHLTFYIQEVYILRERLSAYLKVVMRLRKKRAKQSVVESDYDEVIKCVNDVFEPILKVRGDHVHSRTISDASLVDLSFWTMVGHLAPKYSADAKFQYRLTRKEWLKKLEVSRRQVKKVSNVYFNFMYVELFLGADPVLLLNHSLQARRP